MNLSPTNFYCRRGIRAAAGLVGAVALAVSFLTGTPAAATQLQVTQFKQAVAAAAAPHDAIAAFYRARQYAPLWTTDDEIGRARRAALLGMAEVARVHGLPAQRYDAEDVTAWMAEADSDRARGRLEARLSLMLVRFAHDLQSGVLTPGRVDEHVKREVVRRPGDAILAEFAATSAPAAFLRGLAPRSPEYNRLLRAKLELERRIEAGGWGPEVPAARLEPGDSGPAVVALRNRLIAMGYLARTPTSTYDAAIAAAVRTFQARHAIAEDGVVGADTLAAINVAPEARLGAILVAMERERWLPAERGDRNVWVNLTDFKARLIDRGEITFETKSVIGKHQAGRRTPEFSDTMDHMVINPSWYVPRSIVVGEYLPQLRRNPNALSYMEITDSRGRRVNRSAGFEQYTARSFPFSMRQPPGPRNALGYVKFMFPNPYNIYLHDTPAKQLFSRQVRAFSHGCVRLAEPFEFAYELLSRQTDDPRGFFQSILDTGREVRVDLEQPVPVHLVYRTAYTRPLGGMEYRDDIYGRDAKVLAALRAAGVALPGAAG